MSITQIDRSQLGVLLIDVQPIFWGTAFGDDSDRKEPIMVRLEHLLMLADWMELPLIATFEHPVSRNGELPDRLEAVFPKRGLRYTKKTFDCTSEKTICDSIKRLSVQQFVVTGAETDVCIMQSVFGLLRMRYTVFLMEDCLFTSEPHPGPALRRMYQAGAIPCTVKALAYELAGSVERAPWYPEAWIDKDCSYAKPFPKEFLVPETWPSWKPKL